ncbi:unnamed protein product [Ambrosiozyma monospora]|uniref:Unnamed protein product n=1 Tax=Ambrosiozyma monospora TaxID=43982 RepID=A0A9W7DHR8_AMBMO|nr:unnamed protein product [Ambrosiozyma monospora]
MRNQRHKQTKSSAPKADSVKQQVHTGSKQREIDNWITQSHQQCLNIPTEHIEKIIYNDSLLLLMAHMDLKDDEKENSSNHALMPPPTSQHGPVTTSPQKFAKTSGAENTAPSISQLPRPLNKNPPIIRSIPASNRVTSSNGVSGFTPLRGGGGATRHKPLPNHSSTTTTTNTTANLPTAPAIHSTTPSPINNRLDIDGLGQIKHYSFDTIKDKFLNPQLFQHHKLTLDYINQSNYPPQTLHRNTKRPRLDNLTEHGISRQKFEYLLNTSCPKSASSNELNAVRLMQDPELKANAVTYRYSRYTVSTDNTTGSNNEKITNPYDRTATFMKGKVTYQQELKQLSIMCRFCPHKRWVKAQNFKLHLGLAHGIICLDDHNHNDNEDSNYDDDEYASNSGTDVKENELDSDVSMDDSDSDVKGQHPSSYRDQNFTNDDDDEFEDKDNESEEMYLDEWDQLAEFEIVVLPKPRALFEATPRGVKRYHCQCPKCLDWIRLGFPEPLGNSSNVADSNLPLAFGTGNVRVGVSRRG